jgi:hypothetical protein
MPKRSSKSKSRSGSKSKKSRNASKKIKISPSLSSMEIIKGVNGIDFSSTILIKKYKGKAIYKVEFELPNGKTCANYIDNSNKYVVFKNKDSKYIIFHIEAGNPSQVSDATVELCKTGISKLMKSKNANDEENRSLAKNMIILRSCEHDLDLNAAQTSIHNLNKELRKKCPGLILKLAPFYAYTEDLKIYNEHSDVCIGCHFYDTLILSLCNSEKCISTIEMKVSPGGEITINSKTDKEEEGKKYNKMLRFVLFIVAQKIPGLIHVKSVAVNPISAKLLLHDSGAVIKDVPDNNEFQEYLNKHGVSGSIPMETIMNFYKGTSNKPIHLVIPLTEELADKSLRQFNDLLKEPDINKTIRC